MTEKKSILLRASAVAAMLVLHESALSSPPIDEPPSPAAAQTVTVAPTMPAAAEHPTHEPAPLNEGSGGTSEPARATPEESAVSVQSGQAATAQPDFSGAASSELPAGVSSGPLTAMPESPPPIGVPGTMDAEAMGLTPEERNALREQRFQRMRERFMQRRREMMARWDSYWKILDAMTPEQKEAMEAVFGHCNRRYSPPVMGHQLLPRMPMQPYFGQPEYGFPSGSGFPGQGYGFGPKGTEPYPYGRGPAASWLGEQPMYPGTGQPPYGPEQGSFQGPPPPSVDFPQP
jgi:hypothetical protein